jgi:hypothetical protein
MKHIGWFITIGQGVCCLLMLFMAYKMATVSQVSMSIMFIFLSVLYGLSTPIFYSWLVKGGK